MFFNRSYRYQSSLSREDIKNKLLGKHVQIHHMDFEVFENDNMLRIIPHAEQETQLKTLPITHVEMKEGGGKTKMRISAKMRRIDAGGPLLIVIFCLFMLIAAALFYFFGTGDAITYTYILGGVGLGIFIIFWIKMEAGYFDYVRKVRDFIKEKAVT